ncbi:hypothetical protein ASD86_15170 [Lysobacter sp. Root690]|nr:hypothetical protein ASD86_15170 [Lysobacter sp. Root690]
MVPRRFCWASAPRWDFQLAESNELVVCMVQADRKRVRSTAQRSALARTGRSCRKDVACRDRAVSVAPGMAVAAWLNWRVVN